MKTINSIYALSIRELKITYRNFFDLISIFLFFFLGTVIFVFSVGTNNELYNEIGIGIIWTLILLSNTLSLKRFFQSDFDDNNIIIYHISGLSYEIIALTKIIITWIFIQLPFFVIIPLASIIMNISLDNLKNIFISFLIGSCIISCITSISGAMNLLNKKKFYHR